MNKGDTMKDKQTACMTSLTALHDALNNLSSASQDEAHIIGLRQAFDRLMMGYQNGEYDESTVESGISEIRASMSGAVQSSPLMPGHHGQLREQVIARNSRMLAERLLGEERGTWDSRHVEIVQGAIQQLAQFGGADAVTVASALQSRMSDSIWMGNLELAETRAEVEAESRTLKNDLLEMLNARQSAFESTPYEAPETERVLAADSEKAIDTAVSRANLDTIRTQMQRDASDLKLSKEYIESMAHQVDTGNTDVLARASESLREASNRLIESEYAKLGKIYKGVITSLQNAMQPEAANQLLQGLESALAANTSDPSDIQQHMSHVRDILRPVAASHPELSNALRDIDRIQWRTDMLRNIASESAQPKSETPKVNASQLLDARMLFEQKRMQFERNPEYHLAAPELMKALDLEIEPVSYASHPASASAVVDNSIKRIREIAQSAASGDIGMYAPVAGAEFAKNTRPALMLADQKTPVSSYLPTIQSALARRSNRVMRDVRQVAYQPSVRADMGFAVPRYKMDATAQQPLFKRVRFTQDNSTANSLLPALYKVSGIKVKSDQKTDKPLRKSLFGLNLSAANFEVVKIIENQFKAGVDGFASSTLGGANLDAAQAIPAVKSARDRVGGQISDWVEKRHNAKEFSADSVDMIKTGRMHQQSIESRINAEGMPLPKNVQDRLSPFLGFDLSHVRIFTGPVANMAAEAMGAHAFTLGRNIFMGRNKLDFETPEGLGLLAHEILHTSHFSSGESVDAKENAAESLEARVKKAFGTTPEKALALEEKFNKTAAAPNLAKDALDQIQPGTVGARHKYDPEEVYESVCNKVLELMQDSFKTERNRTGRD